MLQYCWGRKLTASSSEKNEDRTLAWALHPSTGYVVHSPRHFFFLFVVTLGTPPLPPGESVFSQGLTLVSHIMRPCCLFLYLLQRRRRCGTRGSPPPPPPYTHTRLPMFLSNILLYYCSTRPAPIYSMCLYDSYRWRRCCTGREVLGGHGAPEARPELQSNLSIA